MTGRHAAALALFGWYLMLPSLTHEGMDPDSPLSRWGKVEAMTRLGNVSATGVSDSDSFQSMRTRRSAATTSV
jgi:hypothetical protein